jgi:hypothetical protein
VCKSEGIFSGAHQQNFTGAGLLCTGVIFDLISAPAKFMMQSCKFFPPQWQQQQRRMRQQSLQGYHRDNDNNNDGRCQRRHRHPTAAAVAAAAAAAAASAQWQEEGSINIQGRPWHQRWLHWREAKAQQWRQQRSWWHCPRCR